MTRVQCNLFILVEVAWGFIIFDTDGIGVPTTSSPCSNMPSSRPCRSGLALPVGVYLMSWVADRHGRRPAILLATLLGGICFWPFA